MTRRAARTTTQQFDRPSDAADIIAGTLKEAAQRQRRITRQYEKQRSQPRVVPSRDQPRSTVNERVVLVGGTVITAHRESTCRGYWCPIHNVSPHHMRRWAQTWNAVSKQILRVCPCGEEHPDPDDRAPLDHDHPLSCCGCCDRRKTVSRPVSTTTGIAPIAGQITD
jgi:hypothetical protein